VSLLASLPPSEPGHLSHILSFDAKNYHVWTYRQWLCRHFPDPLLSTDMELDAMDALITEDVRNNSAWHHRYFVAFGAEELKFIEEHGGNRMDVLGGGRDGHTSPTGLVVDEEIVEREIHYAKDKIQWAPQNPSPWNYLKGVLKRAGIPLSEQRAFCEEFVGGGGSEIDFMGEQVRSSHAIDWLAEIYALEGGETGTARAKECLQALATKWDPIRQKYWEYRASQLDRARDEEGQEGGPD